MSEKTEAVATMSDQINSVVNNIAEKIEGPADSIREMASSGFDAYVGYIKACGIAACSTSAVLAMASVGIMVWLFTRKYSDPYDQRSARVASGIIGAFIIIICLIVISNYLPYIIYPEGLAVKEIAESLR